MHQQSYPEKRDVFHCIILYKSARTMYFNNFILHCYSYELNNCEIVNLHSAVISIDFISLISSITNNKINKYVLHKDWKQNPWILFDSSMKMLFTENFEFFYPRKINFIIQFKFVKLQCYICAYHVRVWFLSFPFFDSYNLKR